MNGHTNNTIKTNMFALLNKCIKIYTHKIMTVKINTITDVVKLKK